MQREVGIRTITDGEFRRRTFCDDFWGRLEGMTYVPECPPEKFSQLGSSRKAEPAPTWICTAKLRRTRSLYGPQFEGLKKFATAEEIPRLKLTMCAPEVLYMAHREHTYEEGVYGNIKQYFDDLKTVYQEEIADLYAQGCRFIQLDDPCLTTLADAGTVFRMNAIGVDVDEELTELIHLLNGCLEERPRDMCIALHLCAESKKDGHHFAHDAYETIVGRLFNELDVDCFYYDQEHTGSFEPLRFLPRNKTVVLGLINSKQPKIDDPDVIENKIHQAAHVIARGQNRTCEEVLDQICISPQCGFAANWDGNSHVTEATMRAKLELLVKVSKDVWK
ncbi:UROD/MetE-like protein [Dentipellis sp. KUC8613]|nr:UROD/MetE-like protein [Dentipellis sp. KUC8613]